MIATDGRRTIAHRHPEPGVDAEPIAEAGAMSTSDGLGLSQEVLRTLAERAISEDKVPRELLEQVATYD